jgi:hypothetical protein
MGEVERVLPSAGLLPSAKGFVIEYPVRTAHQNVVSQALTSAQGYLQRSEAGVSTAIASLGGEAALAERVAAGQPLTLKLRPGDPLAHPLTSDTAGDGAAGLLLRISPSGRATVQLLVGSAYRFTGLADAQYLTAPPPKRSRLAADIDELGSCPDAIEEAGEAEPLLVVPPFFFHDAASSEYGFRDIDGEAGGAGPARGAGALAAVVHDGPSGPPVAQMVDFRAAGVPAPLPVGNKWASPADVATVLGPLFEKRGAWGIVALCALCHERPL